jgi:hypothetical protein
VALVGEGAVELDQQRLEADAELQGRLASRPASRSARARRSRVSQASIRSRPPSTPRRAPAGAAPPRARRRDEAPLARDVDLRAAV